MGSEMCIRDRKSIMFAKTQPLISKNPRKYTCQLVALKIKSKTYENDTKRPPWRAGCPARRGKATARGRPRRGGCAVLMATGGKSQLTINTWSDETTGKKGDSGSPAPGAMEPSCLRGVRPFRRLGMHPSGPCEFAFCIDKALVHAPFKS